MSYKYKKLAFQFFVILFVVVALRLLLDNFIARDWLRGISLLIGFLCGQFFAGRFFERQWPELKRGWAE